MKKEKVDFIEELSKIKELFLKDVKKNSQSVDEESFEIDICKGYLVMRIECTDEYDDTIAFKQEVEIDYADGNIYQHRLIPLNTLKEL